MRRRFRRPAVITLAVLSATLLAMAISAAFRDRVPPELYVEGPPMRLEAGSSTSLLVSANEPVTYQVTYADQVVNEVSQDLTVPLTVAPGRLTVRIVATDGSGNSTETERSILGVPAPTPSIEVRQVLTAGDPMGVRVHWADGSAAVTEVALSFDGAAERALPVPNGIKAIVPVALETPPGAYLLRVDVTDEFGKVSTATRDISVTALPEPVETLRLSAAVLGLVTPEGRALEKRTLDAAFAAGAPQPLWKGPFRMPIEGYHSAGFGSARRYAPGGPVSYHTGLDLAVPQGTPVHATNDGIVVVAGAYPIKGGLVVIDHGGGVFSMYFHQSKILATVGQHVQTGDVVGLSGTTGLSTGPHLHWEMRVDGVPTNPLAFVDRTFP